MGAHSQHTICRSPLVAALAREVLEEMGGGFAVVLVCHDTFQRFSGESLSVGATKAVFERFAKRGVLVSGVYVWSH